MRLIINNIFRSVKNHPKANFVILLNMILCTMTVFVLLQNYYFLKDHFDIHYGNEVARHYGLEMSNDEYLAMSSDKLNKSPMYYIGQEVNQEIDSNPHLTLYQSRVIAIPMWLVEDKTKLDAYKQVDDQMKEGLDNRGEYYEDDYINFIYFMNVPVNAEKVFNLSLKEGRFFTEDDKKTFDPNVPFPVILGNDFAATFKPGDTIALKGDTAIVIGILEDNMYMSLWGHVEYLDDRILTVHPIVPRDFDMSMEDYYILYEELDQVYCDDPTMDVQKEINRITAAHGYYTYETNPVDGIEISETKDVSAKNVALIGVLALIACIICTCSLSSVLYNRTVQDRSVFCIYMCCGIPLWKINLSLIIEMVIFLGVSFFPTYALSILEYEKLLVPAWQILAFSGIIVLVSLIPVFKINRENNLDMLIRDKIV
ncbi:MAG: ABC transporter permease [Clostridiales bacterium]|nr:ABC transporter permease [Clostridiales bacterium]